ncbi:MAG: hypothetical protein ACYTGZ_18895 [Planctomycetota bacterium]|jgi:hypothetical protein
MSPLLLGHLANFAFAAAYLVRDARALRALSIVGCSLCAVFNYAAPATPLWTAIQWNVFFALVNVVALAGPRRPRRVSWRRTRPTVSFDW